MEPQRFNKPLINNMKKEVKISLFIFLLSLAIFVAEPSLSSSIVDTANPGYAEGNYTLTDVRNYAVYLMQFILGLVGTLSLIMFVYGGVTFLLSAGNTNNVKKGMDIIKAAVIGLVLVFSSVLIIKIFFGGLFGVNNGIGNKSGSTWDEKTGAVQVPKK